MWLRALIAIYIILIHGKKTFGQNYNNMTGLISTVLSGYNTYVRPLENQSATVNVNLSLNLFSILEVDTVQGVLTVVLNLPCTWYDERITWSPSDYGGITSIKMLQSYVWKPDVMLTQPVEFDSVGEKWMHVTYQSGGYASWNPGGVYRVACPMNMKYWPFDEQECMLSYFVYDYTDSEVLLHEGSFATVYYSENGEWSLESTSLSTRSKYGQKEILFTIKIKRRVPFFMITLVIPLIVLSCLCCFVFLLPSQSGERVSFCITILLSQTVFLDVISDEIPKLSAPVPMICQFILVGVLTSAVVTVFVILNLAVYHRCDSVPIGKHYKMIVKLARRGKNKIHVEKDRQVPGEWNKQSAITESRMKDLTISDKLDLTGNVSGSLPTTDSGNQNDDSDMTWQDVSLAIDRILFALIILMVVVCIPAMMIMLSLNL